MSIIITHEDFVQKVYDIYGDKYEVVSTYTRSCDPVSLKCKECKTVFSRIANNVTSRKTVCCPVCDSKKVSNIIIKGVNDLWTTRPDIAKLLKNPEDGYNIRETSGREYDFKCPDCGRTLNKIVRNVSTYGLSCNFCGDHYSYPNRFMYNILNELDVNFEPEFTIKPYKYRYDFMFRKDGNKYLIEMDGAYGHGERDTKSRTVDEQIEIDQNKNRIALENGYILIRIDCKYIGDIDKFFYVSNNILKSELSTLFDISDDVLNRANELSHKSVVSQFAEIWNGGITDYDYYYKKFRCDRHFIRDKLVLCSQLGLIKENEQEIYRITKINAGVKTSVTKGQPVMCNETGEVYHSIAHAQKETGFFIGNYFNKNRKDEYAGLLPDGTKLTWTKISKEQYNEIINLRAS